VSPFWIVDNHLEQEGMLRDTSALHGHRSRQAMNQRDTQNDEIAICIRLQGAMALQQSVTIKARTRERFTLRRRALHS